MTISERDKESDLDLDLVLDLELDLHTDFGSHIRSATPGNLIYHHWRVKEEGAF